MPPQDHLSEPMRQLVAEYMLALTNWNQALAIAVAATTARVI